MNKFTDLGRHVIDAAENIYTTDTWHRMPVPPGIEQDLPGFVKSGRGGEDQFWLVRAPLPPVPDMPKTQEHIDHEAYLRWAAGPAVGERIGRSEVWRAALAWERAQREGKK